MLVLFFFFFFSITKLAAAPSVTSAWSPCCTGPSPGTRTGCKAPTPNQWLGTCTDMSNERGFCFRKERSEVAPYCTQGFELSHPSRHPKFWNGFFWETREKRVGCWCKRLTNAEHQKPTEVMFMVLKWRVEVSWEAFLVRVQMFWWWHWLYVTGPFANFFLVEISGV